VRCHSELEVISQRRANDNRKRCGDSTGEEKPSSSRWRAAVRRSRQFSGALAFGVADTAQEGAELAGLLQHWTAAQGAIGRSLHRDGPSRDRVVVPEPALDQLGQFVALPFRAVEILRLNADQRQAEPPRQLVLLGVPLGLRRLGVLRTVELDREQRRLVPSRHHEVIMRRQGEVVKRPGNAGAYYWENVGEPDLGVHGRGVAGADLAQAPVGDSFGSVEQFLQDEHGQELPSRAAAAILPQTPLAVKNRLQPAAFPRARPQPGNLAKKERTERKEFSVAFEIGGHEIGGQ